MSLTIITLIARVCQYLLSPFLKAQLMPGNPLKTRKAAREGGLRELDPENYLRRRNASQLSPPQINKPAVLGSGILLKLTSSKYPVVGP